jgi:rRNA maturation protein Nop10
MLIYDVGIPCRKGHTTGRYTVSRKCVQCAKDAALAWNKANPDKFSANVKKYRENHPDRVAEQYRNWRVNNPDKVKAKNENWQKANRDKYLDISASWKRRNKSHRNAKNAERRVAKMQRTPKWLTDQDFTDIKKFYDLALELSQAYGFPWHVDHIIPLQGKTVSGLHVVDNLQVIPGSENSRKGNRFYGC